MSKNAIPKIVFSRTLERVTENATLMREGLIDLITQLKSQPGRYINVCGPTIASSLINAGMIDEFRLVIHPIILGSGKPYFPHLTTPIPLRLLETHHFSSGAMYLRYGHDRPVEGYDPIGRGKQNRMGGNMGKNQTIDITEMMVIANQFPVRLQQLGYQVMQKIDDSGKDQGSSYVLPPMVMIPTGPFLMGSDKEKDSEADENECPQHEVSLEPYEIGKYPLTVAEYQGFVWATGHSEPPTGGDVTWENQLERLDHPVVCVSWEDIQGYVKWLAQVTGEEWRMPSEAQWEKAARGIDGRIYPWGDIWNAAKANTYEGGPYTTTPVGHYPQGASPYGCMDMGGNVLEWTCTIYQLYPYNRGDDGDDFNSTNDMVLRGGSWNVYGRYARAAYRFDNRIVNLLNFVGARLSRVPEASS
jgi:formylglycine-generating enzyme required for sulfatase activity